MYKITTITDEKTWNSLKSEWDNLLEKSIYYSLFMSYTWLRTWWETFSNNNLYIILIYSNDKLVFIAPMYKKTENKLKKLKFISSKDSDYLGFIIDKNCNIQDIIKIFIKHIKKDNYWDILELCNIPEYIYTYKNMTSIFKSKFLFIHSKTQSNCYFIKDFNNDKKVFDSLSKTFKKRVKKTINKLGEYEFVILSQSFENGLEKFFELHKKRWSKINLKSRFENIDDVNYFKKLTRILLKDNNLLFTAIKKDNNYLAFQWNLISKNKIYCYLHIFDTDYNKLSLGNLIMNEFFNKFSGKNYLEFDLLRGGESYKSQFTSNFRKNIKLIIVKNNLLSYFKVFLFWINKLIKIKT